MGKWVKQEQNLLRIDPPAPKADHHNTQVGRQALVRTSCAVPVPGSQQQKQLSHLQCLPGASPAIIGIRSIIHGRQGSALPCLRPCEPRACVILIQTPTHQSHELGA